MCYTIPGRIIDTKPGLAIIDYFGETKKARNDFFTLVPGDYVYAQGGFVIQKVRPDEAASSLEAWKELFFELKKIDGRLSRFDGRIKTPVSKESALKFFGIKEPDEAKLLFKTANAVRQKNLSNSCCIHGIIEFSNFCRSDCLYCGIRKSNSMLPRCRMTPREILDSVKEAVDIGFKALVLQSGEDEYYTTEVFEGIVRAIRKDFPALIFLSVGERGRDFYQRMFEAGARGVLLRFETSNMAIYEKIKPGKKFDNRMDHLNFLNKMGYLIATGGLLGLPGQTKEDMVNDVLLARSFGAEMYSFGPFIPHPETPLKDRGIILKEDTLKFIAITRLMVPDAKILVTTALETVDAEMRRAGLLSGANSFMLNVTPLKYRRKYEIYKDRAGVDKPVKDQIEEALALLKELGRAPTDLGL